MVPHFFHVIPVIDETIHDWGFDFEHSAFLLGLLTHIDFFLVKTDHDTGYSGTAHDSGEDRPGCIIASEASLASA